MLACLIAASISALVVPHQEKAFVSYMRTHGLLYTGDEYQLRLGIFLANSRFVQEHNRAGLGFKVSLNHLAVLTPAEYKTLLGARQTNTESQRSAVVGRRADPPASWDWRTQGAVQVIKDQGQCGSCWAFSAVASAESAIFLKGGTLYSFSEQNLVDCVRTCYGCSGGWPSQAYTYIVNKQLGYFNSETDYPYQATDASCRYNEAKAIGAISGYSTIDKGSESDLLNKLYSIGPVSVAIDASHNSFQLYTSGIYNEPSCSTSSLDHAVTAVGYGADGTNAYWIVKNSWGTSWGEQGYIRMSRNKNNQCGIATTAVIATAA
jgi:cathepsin L